MYYFRLKPLLPVLVVGLLAAAVAPAAASSSPRGRLAHSLSPAASLVAKNNPRLLDVRHVTVRGTNSHGTCRFVPPRLTLAPRQKAVEADEISITPANCTSVWQIGTPTRIRHATGLRSSSVRSHGRHAPRGVSPATLYSGSGYEYAWTTDIVNITLTSDQTNISWAWDNSCVRAASGSARWTWDNVTGWSSPYNNGSWISTNCSYSDVWSQSTFKNGAFCWPSTVYNGYSGVYAEGWYDGSLYGWVNNIWYNGSCLPLYLHSEIVRVT